MIRGELFKRKVIIKTDENSDWRVLWGKGFGEKKGTRLILNPVEALYLQQEGEIKIFEDQKEVVEEELIKKFKEEENLWKTFLLYSDMRKRGYNLTMKERRKIEIYERGTDPLSSDPHAVLLPISALTSISLEFLIKEVKAVNKRGLDLILGIVDRDGTLTHYKVGKTFEEMDTKLKLRQTS